jgi:cellulase/cellobiase CelA1
MDATQVQTVAKTLAAKTKRSREGLAKINAQTFELLMERFNTIEAQNNEQLRLLGKHIEEDAKVHGVVERHTTYFSFLALGIPAGVTYIINKMGIKLI